jgi:hypothetical protein
MYSLLDRRWAQNFNKGTDHLRGSDTHHLSCGLTCEGIAQGGFRIPEKSLPFGSHWVHKFRAQPGYNEHSSFPFHRQQHKQSPIQILSLSILAMRILAIFALSVTLAQSLHAQGTFKFTVEANGQGAVPPNDSDNSAGGKFSLAGSMFNGDISFTTTSTAGGMLLAIRDTSGSVVFATDRIQWENVGAPFGFGYAFWDERSLTGSQVADLMAGNWYLVMSNNEFPGGELRGQIQLVPEPSTLALFGVGLAATIFLARKHP